MMEKVFFCTSNPIKAEEAIEVLEPRGYSVRIVHSSIDEPLSDDLQYVVTQKLVQAYRQTHIPLFVEHGGLYIDALNGVPGCLSKLVFTRLRGQLCSLVDQHSTRAATARSTIAYCDGRSVALFQGEIDGAIADRPRGARDYYYDTIFIPATGAQTYAEMSVPDKTRVSHASEAYRLFADYLDNSNYKSPVP